MTTGTRPLGNSAARPRRSRLRALLPLTVAAWLVVEIWLLTVIASASSGWVVLLILLAGLFLGSVVVKRAGRRAFRALSESLRKRESGQELPGRAESEGNGLTVLGGLLLIMPGVLSDGLGLLLLVPPVQRWVVRLARRAVERGLSRARPGTLGDAVRQARMHRPDGKVVPGEVVRDPGPDHAPDDGRPPLAR
ncbi:MULTISPECIES: FxsA family membrane protein [unclassified Streptomyces]|uniref:FxsA family membrane protein n=1 Tax=unclassified Streptomyces TaxID=2593676 RepID=UPI0019066499|nr:FxsA family membrane protein [Streptomyces sp. HSG2]